MSPLDRASAVIIVAGGDDQLEAHLARALAEHTRWCRTNGVGVPGELGALLENLSASRGQGRTSPPVPPANMDDDRMLLAVDYRTAAARLAVSERTVRRMVAAGRIPAVTIGGCRRIRTDDLTDYVANLGG